MEIVYKEQSKEQFKNIMYGEVFAYKEKYFMRSRMVEQNDCVRNAVALDDGELFRFDTEEWVDKVIGKFVVE